MVAFAMLDETAQKEKNRFILRHNGKYACESYNGSVYYGSRNTSNGTVAMGCGDNLKAGDKVSLTLESGKPGLGTNTVGPTLAEITVPATQPPSPSTGVVRGFSYNKTSGRIEVKLDEAAQKGQNRYVVKQDDKNYICESYKGTVYYSYKSISNGVVTMTCPITPVVGSTYSISAEANMPGYDPNTNGAVLASFVATSDMIK
ncbi:hypothetical protein [Kosakonia oryziphila]|uniref:Chitinase n=1 Tax=Kosakonia oryziphila TaxID=1005667 RepID=A0A1C4GMN0_9ENTR|nr:hypothetical protein [Kosakonia oryziphila]SCC69422.1 chitinase [Kosakonia oryziphila]